MWIFSVANPVQLDLDSIFPCDLKKLWEFVGE